MIKVGSEYQMNGIYSKYINRGQRREGSSGARVTPELQIG